MGGSGPDDWAPSAIRYVNVGSGATTTTGAFRFDLVVTNRTTYRAAQSSLNGISGKFARINFATDAGAVALRVTVQFSCCTQANCAACDDPTLSPAGKDACYAAGCCCLGVTCTDQSCCAIGAKETKRRAYGCLKSDDTVVVS